MKRCGDCCLQKVLMSLALVLFDIDGCTAVVPTSKLSQEAKPSVKCNALISGKKYLVEVLEVADQLQCLNRFEECWGSCHRAKHLTKVKVNHGERKRGGYLFEWPQDEEIPGPDVAIYQDHTVSLPKQPKTKKSVQIKKKQSSKIPVKTKIAHSRVVGRKSTNDAPINLPKMPMTRKSQLSLNSLKVQVARKRKNPQEVGVVAASPTKKTKIPVRRTTSLPTKKQVQNVRQKKTTTTGTSKPGQASASTVRTEPRETTDTSQIHGTNGRVVKILYEGSGDRSGDAAPHREPMFMEGLSDDQIDLIDLRIREFDNNRCSQMTQTEDVRIIDNDEDAMKLLECRKKKMVDQCTGTEDLDLCNSTPLTSNQHSPLQATRPLPVRSNGIDLSFRHPIDSSVTALDLTANAMKSKPTKLVILTDSSSHCKDHNSSPVLDLSTNSRPKHKGHYEASPTPQTLDLTINPRPNIGHDAVSLSPDVSQVLDLTIGTKPNHVGQHDTSLAWLNLPRTEGNQVEDITSGSRPVLLGHDEALPPSSMNKRWHSPQMNSTKVNTPDAHNMTIQKVIVYEAEPLDAPENECIPPMTPSPYNNHISVSPQINSSHSSDTVETPSSQFAAYENCVEENDDCGGNGFTTGEHTATYPQSSIPTKLNVEICCAEDMAAVPSTSSVRINSNLVNRFLARSEDIGHLAWGLTQTLFKKEELVGKTLNGTARGAAISPRRKNAILKAVEDQIEGSKFKGMYFKTATKSIVDGLRNASRKRTPFRDLSKKFQF